MKIVRLSLVEKERLKELIIKKLRNLDRNEFLEYENLKRKQLMINTVIA